MKVNEKEITVISGCSWSVGEWPDHSIAGDPINHGGITQYLHDDGKLVVNVGLSGSSNRESYLRTRAFFFANRHLLTAEKTQVLIFQTEWTRDFPYMDAEDQDYYDQPVVLMTRIISRFYYDLSALAQEFNLDIKIIGGAGDAVVIDDFSTMYPGVEVVCQSMTNLIVNGNPLINDPVFSMFSMTNQTEEFLTLFKKHTSDPSQMELLFAEIEKGQNKENVLRQNRQYFYPDGTHPNRQGHRILYDYLREKHLI